MCEIKQEKNKLQQEQIISLKYAKKGPTSCVYYVGTYACLAVNIISPFYATKSKREAE